MEEFLRGFHHLEGDTIGERKKSLHKLLRDAFLDADDLDSLAESLKPETFLESLFMVEVLMHFRKFPELLGLVLEQDVAAERILKSGWFIEALVENASPERLLEEVFPFISLVVKSKIVNKISDCVNRQGYADRLFDLLENAHGIKLASGLIPACSGDKLRLVFTDFDLALDQKTQLKLAKRNPEPLLFYYQKTAEGGGEKRLKITSRHLLNYLVVERFDIFWFVFENHEVGVRLGQRITRRIIERRKDYLVGKPRKMESVLNVKGLHKWLGGDFEALYYNYFPKNIDELVEPSRLSDEIKIARSLPKRARYELFKKTFEKIYKTPLADHLKYITEHLLELMEDKEERERYALIKLNARKNEWRWIKFFPVEKAIALLKDKVNLTANVSSRRDMLLAMADSCKYDNDSRALLDLGNYFVERHSNEDSFVRNDFIFAIDRLFGIEKLGEAHWIYLDQLMALIKIDKEYNYRANDVLKKQLRRNIRLKKPSGEIKRCFKEWYLKEDTFTLGYNLVELFPDFQDEYVDLLIEINGEVNEVKERRKFNFFLLLALARWNAKHPSGKLPIPPTLLDSIQYNEFFGENGEIFAYLMRQDERNDFICDWYWRNYVKRHDDGVNVWLLKHKPGEIVANVNVFVGDRNLYKISDGALKLCRQYEHLGLPQQMASKCLGVLSDEENAYRQDAVRILSFLLPAEEYEKIIEPYHPTDEKTDLTDGNQRELFVVQCSVAANLKNAHPPAVALKNLIRYCKEGDRFKSALRSLLYVLPRVPLIELETHLEALESCSVSVQKNALTVSCDLFCKARVLTLLKRRVDSASHVSVQKNLFWLALDYLKQNPYDEFWDLLQTCVLKLDGGDSEALNLAVEWRNVPSKYRHLYVPFVWDVLENKNVLDEHKYKLLDLIGSNLIERLPSEFCVEVIKKEFFNSDATSDCLQIMETFAVMCLNANCSKKLLDAIFSNLKQTPAPKNHLSNRFSFVKNLCLYSLKAKTEASSSFAVAWQERFEETEAFKEHVLLQATALYRGCGHEKFPGKIVDFCESCTDKYGLVVLELFCDALLAVFEDGDVNRDRSDGECALDFINGVYEASDSTACRLLFLKLLSHRNPEFCRNFNDKLAELAESCDDVVKMYLIELQARWRDE